MKLTRLRPKRSHTSKIQIPKIERNVQNKPNFANVFETCIFSKSAEIIPRGANPVKIQSPDLRVNLSEHQTACRLLSKRVAQKKQLQNRF